MCDESELAIHVLPWVMYVKLHTYRNTEDTFEVGIDWIEVDSGVEKYDGWYWQNSVNKNSTVGVWFAGIVLVNTLSIR